MTRAVFPGSFDPITNGHVDIIARASALFDEVTVAVFDNAEKNGMFSIEKRLDFIRQATRGFPNVRVDAFDGLLIDYVRDNGFSVIVRGVRNSGDFDYEYQLADIYAMTGGAETVFFPSRGKNANVSSSMVRELIRYGRDPSPFVPFEFDPEKN